MEKGCWSCSYNVVHRMFMTRCKSGDCEGCRLCGDKNEDGTYSCGCEKKEGSGSICEHYKVIPELAGVM